MPVLSTINHTPSVTDSRKLTNPSDMLLIRSLCLEFRWSKIMSKREIIDFILEINKSARPEFLAQFSAEELDLYLEHLMELDLEEIALCA
jgi:hypothetical protein